MTTALVNSMDRHQRLDARPGRHREALVHCHSKALTHCYGKALTHCRAASLQELHCVPQGLCHSMCALTCPTSPSDKRVLLSEPISADNWAVSDPAKSV